MANTRNNPIEDLAMHLPMICDRYELRDVLQFFFLRLFAPTNNK